MPPLLLQRAAVVAVALALFGCASPREMLGWAKDEPFILSPEQTTEFSTREPLFAKGLAQVSFDVGKVCLPCGDFSDNNTIGMDHVEQRLRRDYVNLLAQQLGQSRLFPGTSAQGFSMRGVLVELDQQSSVGAAAERKSPMSSGAVLSTRLTVRYDLVDQGQVLDSWRVTTRATSNSIAASTRLVENIDGALKRNLRALLLTIVADHSPGDAPRARAALVSLQSEVDSKRIALGYLAYGTAKTVSTVASATGDVLTAVAKNSDAVAAGMSSATTSMAEMNRANASAYNQALMARRSSSGGSTTPDDSSSRASAPAASSTSSRTAEGRSAGSATNGRAVAAAEPTSSGAGQRAAITKEPARNADASSRPPQDDEALRKRQQQEAADRKAKAEADRLAKERADKEAEQQALTAYLNAMRNGIRLVATTCPGGEGRYFATGTRPKVKGDYCIDVAYEAYCPGNAVPSRGVAKTFVGLAGCFGDTYEISPKPACAAKDVQVKVAEVRPGCN